MPSRFLHGDIGQLADHHSANVERGNTRAGSSPAVATINKRDVPRLLWKGRIEAKCTRLESVRGNTHDCMILLVFKSTLNNEGARINGRTRFH